MAQAAAVVADEPVLQVRQLTDTIDTFIPD